jgi:hypothetical protein
MAKKAPKISKEEYVEQRQEKLSAARDAIVEGIKNLETDKDWKDFLNRLTKRGRFSPSRLSFGNQILVYTQFPEATAVATYRSWFKLYRYPAKGSHGIMIFQPRPYKKEEIDEDQDDKKVKRGIYFKPIYVFDVSQTEGKELPDWLAAPEVPDVENKEIFKDCVEKLAELAEKMPGNPVSKVEIRSRKSGESASVFGGYYPDSKLIVVFKTDNRGQMFKTLVHEIAHAIMHADVEKPRNIKEIEAESVAFVVNKTLGLDTSGYSFKYIASWASGGKKLDDVAIKLVERTAQHIVSTANIILDTIMPLMALPDKDISVVPDTPEPVKEDEQSGSPPKSDVKKPGRPKGSKNKPKASEPAPSMLEQSEPSTCGCGEPDPKSELIPGIDYAPQTDMNGIPVHPGDYVSFKTYPRGTGRGTVIVSKRVLAVMPDGKQLPSMAIDSDGTIYAFYSGGVKKLKKQPNIKEPARHIKSDENKLNQDDYKFYVVVNNQIVSGNEFKEDAKEFIEENVPDSWKSNCKIYSKKYMYEIGTDPDVNENWNIPHEWLTQVSEPTISEPTISELTISELTISEPAKKGRGRPKGSKNKPKSECICLGKTAKQEGKTDKDFSKKALAEGIKVELEHTDDIEIAKTIAKDHLTEDKNYYKKLKKAGL